MKVQYRITEDDYANVARFAAWRQFMSRSSAMTLVAAGIIVALLGIGMWTRPAVALFLAFVPAGAAIGFAVDLLVRTPMRARRHYRQYKDMREPLIVELTDAGIKFSTPDGEAALPWSKVFQWRQNGQFILIYRMPVLFHILPKSISREGFDVPLLLQRLAKCVGPER
jgi:YcxB-like protein